MKKILLVLVAAVNADSSQLFKVPLPTNVQQIVDKHVKPLTDLMEPYKKHEAYTERGVPTVHEELDCNKTTEDPQCKHEVMKNSPMVGAGHHVRAKTNSPIIGILTQPIPDNEVWRKEYERLKKQIEGDESHGFMNRKFLNGTFVESSHVQFLESAGARVVPVDHTLSEEAIKIELANLNGLYIPGDTASLVTNQGGEYWQYTKTLQRILLWAQNHNAKENQHFPILGVGYGFLAMVKSQMADTDNLDEFESSVARNKLQMNLAHHPKHTYLFDEYEKDQLETILDKIKFFTDVEKGISMNRFVLDEKILSTLFVPVASFDNSKVKSSNEEMVAALEGVVYPWFGVMYRIDRMQFSMEHQKRDMVDHSREAIMHAQKIANLFVDEARLSENKYYFVSHEVAALNKLLENDQYMVEVPLIHSDNSKTIRTQIYLL